MKVLPMSNSASVAKEYQRDKGQCSPVDDQACPVQLNGYIHSNKTRSASPMTSTSSDEELKELKLFYLSDEEETNTKTSETNEYENSITVSKLEETPASLLRSTTNEKLQGADKTDLLEDKNQSSENMLTKKDVQSCNNKKSIANKTSKTDRTNTVKCSESQVINSQITYKSTLGSSLNSLKFNGITKNETKSFTAKVQESRMLSSKRIISEEDCEFDFLAEPEENRSNTSNRFSLGMRSKWISDKKADNLSSSIYTEDKSPSSPICMGDESSLSVVCGEKESPLSPDPEENESPSSPIPEGNESPSSPIPEGNESSSPPILEDIQNPSSLTTEENKIPSSPIPNENESTSSPITEENESPSSRAPEDNESTSPPISEQNENPSSRIPEEIGSQSTTSPEENAIPLSSVPEENESFLSPDFLQEERSTVSRLVGNTHSLSPVPAKDEILESPIPAETDTLSCTDHEEGDILSSIHTETDTPSSPGSTQDTSSVLVETDNPSSPLLVENDRASSPMITVEENPISIDPEDVDNPSSSTPIEDESRLSTTDACDKDISSTDAVGLDSGSVIEESPFLDDSLDISSDEGVTSVAKIIENLEEDGDSDSIGTFRKHCDAERPCQEDVKNKTTVDTDFKKRNFSCIREENEGDAEVTETLGGKKTCLFSQLRSNESVSKTAENEDVILREEKATDDTPTDNLKPPHDSDTSSQSLVRAESSVDIKTKPMSSVMGNVEDANTTQSKDEPLMMDIVNSDTEDSSTEIKRVEGSNKRSRAGNEASESSKRMKLYVEPKEAPSPDPTPDHIPEPSSLSAVAKLEETSVLTSKVNNKYLGEMEEIDSEEKKEYKRILTDKMKVVKSMTRKELERHVLRLTVSHVTMETKLALRYQEIQLLNEKASEWKKQNQALRKQVVDLNSVYARLEQTLKKSPKPARPLKVTRSVGLQVSVNHQGLQTGPKVGPVQQPKVIRTLRPVNRAVTMPPLVATSTAKTSLQQLSPPKSTMSQSLQPGKLRVSLPGQGLSSPGVSVLNPVARTVVSSNSNIVQNSVVQTRTTSASIVSRVANSVLSPITSSQVNSGSLVTSQTVNTQGDTGIRTQQINLVQQPGGRISILPPQNGSAPVAYWLQSSQSRPVILTPTNPNTSRSVNSMSLNAVQWVQSVPKSTGSQPNILQRQLSNTNGIPAGQVTVRSPASGAPLQRDSIYSIPTVQKLQSSHYHASAQPTMHHPAPLPPVPPYPPSGIGWKLPPPKPVLKISKVANGIVLSWNMTLTAGHEDMKSYQIYAYQESKDPPSSSLWKTVGDVKALALPMACTLTQFKDGHKYHFSVRAVDIHSRMGPHSDPTHIILVRS